ncbi:hypothetical protein [Paraburkholderia panacisoli]|uniref:hypothetical protein n=1 Tax=Paraburkholderia panacisoli TaxID=2603818 RepID=UPI00165F72A9|nr:hypothetical protein [Paraburkholderia panacisoli]
MPGFYEGKVAKWWIPDDVVFGPLSERCGRSNDSLPAMANVGNWPNPELSAAGHALPESQINELPFENFL